MSQLRIYKFLVIPVLQEVDDNGEVIAEAQMDRPDTVFGLNGLHAYADNFGDRMSQLMAGQNGQVPTFNIGE